MDTDERRRMEDAMAKISREKREVEADPAAAVRESLDASMAKFKRRLLYVLFGVILAAIAVALYLRSRG